MYSERLIDVEGAAKAAATDKEQFTLLRRGGFGASESAILLGVNPFKTVDKLILEKNSEEVTAEELEVATKPTVKMGNDCEPIVLQKASEYFGSEITKPDTQYRLKDYPALTVNYDGLMEDIIPVEAKTISIYGDKHFNWDNAYNFNSYGIYASALNMADHVDYMSKLVGIPGYYYTQVQQQLLGTEATYAYLAALRVKTWDLYIFMVREDEIVQRAIIDASKRYAEQCPKILEKIIKT